MAAKNFSKAGLKCVYNEQHSKVGLMELSGNTIKGLDRITAIADIIFNDPKTPWNKDRALMIQRLVEAIKKGEDLHDPAD